MLTERTASRNVLVLYYFYFIHGSRKPPVCSIRSLRASARYDGDRGAMSEHPGCFQPSWCIMSANRANKICG